MYPFRLTDIPISRTFPSKSEFVSLILVLPTAHQDEGDGEEPMARSGWAQAAALVWGPVTVVLLVGTGIYLSLRLKFTHLRKFGLGWRFAAQRVAAPAQNQAEASVPPGDISPWQSMMTMPAGAIGNGNIAGVATAIAIGGPGAVFWMWASGLFAMATKYSEAVLGLTFREQLPDGSVAGGPMYYLRNGV